MFSSGFETDLNCNSTLESRNNKRTQGEFLLGSSYGSFRSGIINAQHHENVAYTKYIVYVYAYVKFGIIFYLQTPLYVATNNGYEMIPRQQSAHYMYMSCAIIYGT